VEFIQECQDGNFEGVVAAYRTFASTEMTGSVDKELLQVLPESLLFLSHCGMHLWTLTLFSFNHLFLKEDSRIKHRSASQGN
jgi:hypothetical protein